MAQKNDQSWRQGNLFSVFVDHLPEQMNTLWLRNIFSKCGKVMDSFVSHKQRIGRFGTFGFVRFHTIHEVYRAINTLNGIWLLDQRLLVKKARFELASKKSSSLQRRNSSIIMYPSKKDGRSYKETLLSQKTSHILEEMPLQSDGLVKVEKTEDNDRWLKRCAIAIVHDYSILNGVGEAIRSEGVFTITVKPLGGLKVLLEFSDVEDKITMLSDGRGWLDTWFSVIYEWSPREFNKSRRSWVSIEGVPLHGWSIQTFTAIGERWGSVLMVDDITANKIHLEQGWVLLETEHASRIQGSCELLVGNSKYTITVREEGIQRYFSAVPKSTPHHVAHNSLDGTESDRSGSISPIPEDGSPRKQSINILLEATAQAKENREVDGKMASGGDLALVSQVSDSNTRSPTKSKSEGRSGQEVDGPRKSSSPVHSNGILTKPNCGCRLRITNDLFEATENNSPSLEKGSEENEVVEKVGAAIVSIGPEPIVPNGSSTGKSRDDKMITSAPIPAPASFRSQPSILATRKKKKKIFTNLAIKALRKENHQPGSFISSQGTQDPVMSSLSSGNFRNRNRIILKDLEKHCFSEANRTVEIGKLLNINFKGKEEEVKRRIFQLEWKDSDKYQGKGVRH